MDSGDGFMRWIQKMDSGDGFRRWIQDESEEDWRGPKKCDYKISEDSK